MIMGYVCNLVPEDDRSAGLESLLISLLLSLRWGLPFPRLPAQGVRSPGRPAWDGLELGGR